MPTKRLAPKKKKKKRINAERGGKKQAARDPRNRGTERCPTRQARPFIRDQHAFKIAEEPMRPEEFSLFHKRVRSALLHTP